MQFLFKSTKDKNCPPLTCDPIQKTCPLTSTYHKYLPSTYCLKNPKDDGTDSVIKYYITNPIIQQQVNQQPANVLIPMDTLYFAN
ncbi:MAG TPA: hypothetical protein VN703_00360 [Candidatus Sulfopaludibacter sp.]|nr:hypothetical protein [Candidatus Sulfopaludibacter sp.]